MPIADGTRIIAVSDLETHSFDADLFDPINDMPPGTEVAAIDVYSAGVATTFPGPELTGFDLEPFFIYEYDSWDQDWITAAETPANISLPDGYALVSQTVSLMQNGTASVVGDQAEPDDDFTRSLTLVIEAPDLTQFSYVVSAQGRGLHVPPVAAAGTLALGFVAGAGVTTIPFSDLVVPSAASTNWSPTILDVEILTPVTGISIGTSGLVVDQSLLALQSDTPFAVRFTHAETFLGLHYSVSVTKQALITVAGPTVVAQQPIAFVNDQVFVDTPLVDQINFSTLSDMANYTGSIIDSVTVRARRNGAPIEITDFRPSSLGIDYEIIVDVRDNLGADIDLQLRDERSAQALFTVTETGDAETGITWSYAALDALAGPPDSYRVLSLEIDGRFPKPGLNMADIRASETMLVDTHAPYNPVLSQAGADPAVGDLLSWNTPIIAGPDGVAVSLQIDLLRDGVVIVPDAADSYTLVAGDDGASLGLRYTYSAPGLADLVIDGPSLAIDFNLPVYDQTAYETGGLSRFHLDGLTEAPRRLISGWVTSTLVGSQRLFSRNANNAYIELKSDGQIQVKTYDSSGMVAYRAGSPVGVLTAGTTAHIALVEDLSLPAVELYVNGVLQPMTVAAPLSAGTGLLNAGLYAFLATRNGGEEVDGTFSDLMVFEGGAIGAAELYNGGTPPAPSTLSETPLYLFGGALTAAQINAVDTTQNAAYTADAANLTEA